MGGAEVTEGVSEATRPRLAALIRMLLQLRLVLAALALLLVPSERLTPTLVIAILTFALLSGLVAKYWERFVPYLQSHPLLVTLDVLVASGLLAIDGPSGPVFLTTILTATISGLLFGGRGVLAVAALQIFGYAVALLTYTAIYGSQVASLELITFQTLIVYPLLYPVAGYVGLRVRDILTELAREQHARQEAQRAAAAAEERNRLARDMHDSVSKTLRGAAMAAQSLTVWVQKDPERAAATALQVANAAETAAQEARALLRGLRDGSAAVPFRQAVEEIVTDWSAENEIPTVVHLPTEDPVLLVRARQEGLAILKEALTNIARHAAASSVTVTVSTEAEQCIISVADDGAGFDTSSDQVRRAEREDNGHYGLLGMAERAEQAGGSIEIDSETDRGTVVRVLLPTAAPCSETGEDPDDDEPPTPFPQTRRTPPHDPDVLPR